MDVLFESFVVFVLFAASLLGAGLCLATLVLSVQPERKPQVILNPDRFKRRDQRQRGRI